MRSWKLLPKWWKRGQVAQAKVGTREFLASTYRTDQWALFDTAWDPAEQKKWLASKRTEERREAVEGLAALDLALKFEWLHWALSPGTAVSIRVDQEEVLTSSDPLGLQPSSRFLQALRPATRRSLHQRRGRPYRRRLLRHAHVGQVHALRDDRREVRGE